MIFEKTYFEDETISDLIGFEHKEFIECEISSLNISNKSLRGSIFVESTFTKVDLSNCDLLGASFRDCNFEDCKMVGLNWTNTKNTLHLQIKDSICDFNVFQEMKLAYTSFINSRLRDCDFYKSELSNSTFDNCDFLNSNLTEANLTNTDFSNSINYHIDPTTSNVKGAKISIEAAINIVKNMGIEINLGP